MLLVALAALAVALVALVAVHEGFWQGVPPTTVQQWASTSLKMRPCTLTTYSSYPARGSAEWADYSGGDYAGCFAGQRLRAGPDWVRARNIVAVHSKDFPQYRGKWLFVVDKRTARGLLVKVLDECNDADTPDSDCSRNKRWHGNGFLIDVEHGTAERLLGQRLDAQGRAFGMRDGLFAVMDGQPKPIAAAPENRYLLGDATRGYSPLDFGVPAAPKAACKQNKKAAGCPC